MYIIIIATKLEDLPDFLSGEEQRNTVHIQIHYNDTRLTKERTTFLSSLTSKSSPDLKRRSKKEDGSSRSQSSKSPNNLVVSVMAVEDTEMAPKSKSSPRLDHERVQYLTSPTGTTDLPSQRTPPPGMLSSTRSNLEISHHVPINVEKCSKSDIDLESPILDTFHKSVSLLSLGKVRRDEDNVESRTACGSSTRLLPVPAIALKLENSDRTTSQPELLGNIATSHSMELQDSKSLSTFSEAFLSRSLGASSSYGSEGHLNREVDKIQGAGETVLMVIDLYILKQVTNFYHLLKEAWNNVKIVINNI